MFNITSKECSMNDNPYDSLIKTFFKLEFPKTSCLEADDMLEGVMLAILASGQVRYGPKPSLESLVAIRDVIRKAIMDDRPIPMLSPWGSRKSQLGEPLDVAEVYAMKQLASLQERVVKIYSPGVQVNIRLEDASGPYVFTNEGEESRIAEAIYCDIFVKMVNILGFNGFIQPIRESSIYTPDQLATEADKMLPIMKDYLDLTDRYGFSPQEIKKVWEELNVMGWNNSIPKEQRNYYRGRYKFLYPGLTDEGATIKLARYFSQAWARVKLHGYGDDPRWNGSYIKLSFVGPIPGTPSMPPPREIFYRTLPTKFTEYHAMPWRAKGYLQIDGDGVVTPKIASWKDPQEYARNELTFSDGKDTATVRSDFIVRE